MTLALETVLLALMICWPSAGGYSTGSHGPVQQAQTMPITLTSIHPSGSFPLSSQALLNNQVLRVPISKIINPAGTPFEIVMHLIVCSDKSPSQPRKLWLGNFSPFPANHAGTFEVSTSVAARQLETWSVASGATHVKLLLELKPIHNNDALASVQIVLGTPEWRNMVP